MFKSYTRKSSAITGAQRAGLEPHAVTQLDGKWGFYLPSNSSVRLPSLSSSSGAPAERSGSDTVVVAKTVAEAISKSTILMMDKVNGTLTDIKKILFEENAREEAKERADKLKGLEDERESPKSSDTKSRIPFLDGLKDKASGLMVCFEDVVSTICYWCILET